MVLLRFRPVLIWVKMISFAMKTNMPAAERSPVTEMR
jgi:hypothetical protein